MARPTKFTPETVEKLCTAVRQGMTYALAAAYAGIHYDTLNEWRRSKAEFSEALTRAEAEGALANLARVEQAAEAGDWRASAWLLERRYPHDYGKSVQERRIEHSGAVVHTDVDLDEMIEQELAKTRLNRKLDELAERRRLYHEAQERQALQVEPAEAEPRSAPPRPSPPPRRREPLPAPERDYAFGPDDRDEERGVWQRWA
jgi:hypothetical protein